MGTASPHWSAATWSPHPGPLQTGMCPYPGRPCELLGQTRGSPGCKDSVRAVKTVSVLQLRAPSGPPCWTLPALWSAVWRPPQEPPSHAVLARCLCPASPGIGDPGPPLWVTGIYRAGSVVRSVLHRQRSGITQVFTYLCIFWVTFYFTVVQGREGSRICVQAFSQNCRKSIQCLV